MRLVCPNCGAQYEVADDVIPETGRDVQCSNCGHTWFEQPGASAAAEEAATAPAPAPPPEPAPEPEPEPEAQTAPEPEASEPEPELVPDPQAPPPRGPGPEDAPPADPPQPERRPIDPQVADILREERAHEEAARKAEAETLESQPDLGLDSAGGDSPDLEEQRAQESQRRVARLRGEGPAAAAAAAAATVAASREEDDEQTRRQMLPDIEEINSTLRPEGDATAAAEEEAAEQRRGGFRRGFVWVVFLAVLALLVYTFAPQIGDLVPALEAPLTAYTDWVDGLRLWLDLKMQDIMAASEAPDTPPAETAPDVTPEPPAEPVAPEASDG